MQILEVTEEKIRAASDKELHSLRDKFARIYPKSLDNEYELNTDDLLDKYSFVMEEFNARNLVPNHVTDIDKSLMKRRLDGTPVDVLKEYLFQADRQWRELSEGLWVDLSVGGKKPSGYIRVSESEDVPDSDIVLNLKDRPLPFEDGALSEVRAHGFLESCENTVSIMNEIHRVLKPGGILNAKVLSCDCPAGAVDPTIKSRWNRASFNFFMNDGLREKVGACAKFKPVDIQENKVDDNVKYVSAQLVAVKGERK